MIRRLRIVNEFSKPGAMSNMSLLKRIATTKLHRTLISSSRWAPRTVGATNLRQIRLISNQESATSQTERHGRAECANCDKRLSCCTLICPNCSALQSPHKSASHCGSCSYFDILGSPERYDVNSKELEQSFWNLQRNLHPDKHAAGSSRDQELSADHCALVNKAYDTLKDPVARAKYLLKIKGQSGLEEGDAAYTNPMILMEVMEQREAIEMCSNLDDLLNMKEDVMNKIVSVESRLNECFAADNLEQAKTEAVHLIYLQKIVDEIKEKSVQVETA